MLTVLQVGYPFACVGPATAGGAEQILGSLDAALVARGHRSLVLAPEGSLTAGELIALPPVPTTIDPVAREFVHATLRRALARVLAEQHVDVVHLHGVDYGEYLPRTALPTLVTLHLSAEHYPSTWAVRRPNVHLCCVSETQRRGFQSRTQELELVPNGIALEALEPELATGHYVACLGRVCEEKGYHFALDAAHRAGLPLKLAGKVHPYDAHRAYFAREIEPRLDALRTFVGPVDPAARRDLLAHARCLVVPSLVAETSCLVAMEALACGTPVVALDRGALHEIVIPGRTGLLVRTPDELGAALLDVASIDRATCQRVARERFAADAMHERYLQLYRRIAGAAQRAS